MNTRRMFAAVLLAATSCSYSSDSESRTPALTNNLTEQEQLCVEERLASGWELNLSNLQTDLSPEQEIAVDMAVELCRLDTATNPTVPTFRNDQPQVSDELLEAPVTFDSGDNPPGTDSLLDEYWLQCGLGEAKACDELFYLAPPGSAYEQFAFSCGGRRNMDLSLIHI